MCYSKRDSTILETCNQANELGPVATETGADRAMSGGYEYSCRDMHLGSCEVFRITQVSTVPCQTFVFSIYHTIPSILSHVKPSNRGIDIFLVNQ